MSTKVHLAKAMVFPVVMYGCESWSIKKAECWRIDAFELWCWRRLLRVSWTAKRSNQYKSVLGVHWKDWCWSWNSNALVTWCEELTHLKRPWCWERLRAGGEGDDRGWDGWMASPTQWTWVWVDSGSWWWTRRPGVLQFMGSQRVRHDWATELNWLFFVNKNDIEDSPAGAVDRSRPANAEDTGSVPGWGRFHMPLRNQASTPQLLWALEPASCSYWSPCAWSLCSAVRSHHSETPAHHSEE